MPQAAASHVAALLRDADADVRILACDLAREVASPDMTRALAGVLENDQVVNVCTAAIDALAEVGAASDIPIMQRCLDRFPQESFLAFSVKIATARLATTDKSG
jgi:HEAT repeat protein